MPSVFTPTVPARTLVVHLRYLRPFALEVNTLDAARRAMYDCIDRVLSLHPNRFDYVYLMHKPGAPLESARAAVRLVLTRHARFSRSTSSRNATVELLPTHVVPPSAARGNFFNQHLDGDTLLAHTLHELSYVASGEAFIHTRFSTFAALAQAMCHHAVDAWVVTLGRSLVRESFPAAEDVRERNCARLYTSEPLSVYLPLAYQQCRASYVPVFGDAERVEF